MRRCMCIRRRYTLTVCLTTVVCCGRCRCCEAAGEEGGGACAAEMEGDAASSHQEPDRPYRPGGSLPHGLRDISRPPIAHRPSNRDIKPLQLTTDRLMGLGTNAGQALREETRQARQAKLGNGSLAVLLWHCTPSSAPSAGCINAH